MSKWYYRILKNAYGFGLFEVYFNHNEEGTYQLRSERPTNGYFESVEELIFDLEMQLRDAKTKKPMLDPWADELDEEDDV